MAPKATKKTEKTDNSKKSHKVKASSAKAVKADKTTTKSTSGTKKLVIVESPTKAKTIRKFLGKEFYVESCMGHVRDLPQSAKDIPEKYKKEEWATLGVNVNEEFAPIYCIPKNKEKVVRDLREKLKSAAEIYLATDEDREGESISWHLTELLKPKVPVKRMVFNEITKDAIKKALVETRDIDQNLVKAQEARRILDRLVGYTISPLLWKKIDFGLSAGRVQSVAVRLIVEREHERLKFNKAEYWGLSLELEKSKSEFEGRLIQAFGEKIATGKDFDPNTGKTNKKDVIVLDERAVTEIVNHVKKNDLKVVELEEKPVTRRPAPPFITSTLQQEANRKLGMSSRETMQVAQKLYEQGYITYMRTDSTYLSQEGLDGARNCILQKYGKDYLPASARNFEAKKVKGAQEAHEAIRPAGNEFEDPEATGLSGQQLKLYDLIWKRTVASQMADAKQKQVSVKIECGDTLFSSSGMTIEFPGYLRAYVEGSDDPDAELQEREVRLPQLKVGDKLNLNKAQPTQHETKPPARYTEATLVQTLEKEGVGRPSTYAAIIGTIIDRGYVRRISNALAPTFTALIVVKLLKNYLPEYVDLGFTSEMEKSLDDIADGDLDSLKYLDSIYFGKKGLKSTIATQEKKIDPDEARSVELEGLKGFSFRVGRYGAYLCQKRGKEEICATLPDNESPADMTVEKADKLIDQKINGNDAIGKDPKTDQSIYVLNGRYGPYVQKGEAEDSDKVKRMAIPQGFNPEDVTLEKALYLLEMPKKIGIHPETKKEIKIGIGRFGPYVVCDGDYRSIPKTENIFEFSFEKAMELYKQPKKGRGRASIIKELGAHPDIKQPIVLMSGPYGPYVKCGKVNASLPEGMKAEDVTLKQAESWIADKLQKR